MSEIESKPAKASTKRPYDKPEARLRGQIRPQLLGTPPPPPGAPPGAWRIPLPPFKK